MILDAKKYNAICYCLRCWNDSLFYVAARRPRKPQGVYLGSNILWPCCSTINYAYLGALSFFILANIIDGNASKVLFGFCATVFDK